MRACAALALTLVAGSSLAAEKKLTVGVADALTGGGAVYGLPQANAVKMAAEEINAAAASRSARIPTRSMSLPMTTRPTRPKRPMPFAS